MNRIKLYAISARNRMGRALGLPTELTYTASQIAVASAMRSVWLGRRWSEETVAACLGCTEGEDSLLTPPTPGDHGKAGGMFQWHDARRGIIELHMGIDVWAAGPEDTARAFVGEISEPWSAYRHVEAALVTAEGATAKMQVLLAKFEQSGDQPRDLARRVPMAEHWLAYFRKAAA